MQQLTQCDTRRNNQLFKLTVLDETKLKFNRRQIVLLGKTNIDYPQHKIILDETDAQNNLNARCSRTQP